jgi:pyruvate dehydrogenase E1 component
MAFPTVRAYDPAFAYETAVIIFDGLKRMYEDNETAIYYITLENENYMMPEMPAGVEDGIIRGMYKLKSVEAEKPSQHVQLLGSGPILRETLRAADILASRYNVSSDVWSVTSFNQLRRDAQETQRWNMLNPEKPRRHAYVEEQLGSTQGPIIAASDYMKVLADQLTPYLGNRLFALGTDGMGRSESREALRRHFEVDAESITVAALYKLMGEGKCDGQCVANAIRDLGISSEKKSALYA